MAEKDPNFKRLGTILFLFIIVLLINVAQAVLLNAPDQYNEQVSQEFSSWDMVLSFLTFFIGGFVITSLNTFPMWMSAIILPIYSLLMITFWYLIYDFASDISILGTSI